MIKKIIKLQNIVMTREDMLKEHFNLAYRGDKFEYLSCDEIFLPELSKKFQNSLNNIFCYKLHEKKFAEFFTYLNAFSIAKWKRYTSIENYYLKIKACGSFNITFFGHYRNGKDIKRETLNPLCYELSEPTEIIIPVPETKGIVLGFQIEPVTDFYFYYGYYFVMTEQNRINKVDISIAATTFKREEYITKNIELLKNELFYSDEEAGKHIRLNVVDNGRTLTPSILEDEFVKVFPNDNVGGAGGFSRGILESMKDGKELSHILFMDDDVKILPESLIRTYAMLSLVTEEFRGHFISGAMLYMEQPNIQHEDVGYVHEEAYYTPLKPRFDLNRWDSVFANEEIYPEKPDSYAAWWYCCAPIEAFKESNMPVPLFIRGDDVEFSTSRKAKFITLGGICIWHKGFVNKYSASLEMYLVHRNSLIIQATSGIFADRDFIKRITDLFWLEIKRYNYQSCELLLDALEDFCSGPEFLKTPQGERIIKEKSLKNEKMYPINEKYSAIQVDFSSIYCREGELTKRQQFWYDKSFNGHLLPKFMWKKKIAFIAYDWFDAPVKQYLARTVLAVNPHEGTAVMRWPQRKKFLKLVLRLNKLVKYYQKNKAEIMLAYKEEGKRLKSREFWEGYLSL